MTEFATLHGREVRSLDARRRWCFNQVGGLEVATTPERLADLHRQAGLGDVLGRRGPAARPRRVRAAAPAARPPSASSAASTRPTDGLAKAVRAVVALAARATEARGARFLRATPRSIGIEQAAAGSPACAPTDGVIAADIVVSCAGFWGAAGRRDGRHGRPAGADGPPVREDRADRPSSSAATPNGSEAGLPILRHQDQDLYFREHVDRLGIGSYGHRPMPVDLTR